MKKEISEKLFKQIMKSANVKVSEMPAFPPAKMTADDLVCLAVKIGIKKAYEVGFADGWRADNITGVPLQELNKNIQVCPECGKIDAYKNDEHICDKKFQEYRQQSNDCYK